MPNWFLPTVVFGGPIFAILFSLTVRKSKSVATLADDTGASKQLDEAAVAELWDQHRKDHQDLMDFMHTVDMVEAELLDVYGLLAKLGVKRLDHRLSDVTVVVDRDVLDDRPEKEVVALVNSVLLRHFGEEPVSIVVDIAHKDTK